MCLYQPGDLVKAEFRNDLTDEVEWMWIAHVVFGPDRQRAAGERTPAPRDRVGSFLRPDPGVYTGASVQLAERFRMPKNKLHTSCFRLKKGLLTPVPVGRYNVRKVNL